MGGVSVFISIYMLILQVLEEERLAERLGEMLRGVFCIYIYIYVNSSGSRGGEVGREC